MKRLKLMETLRKRVENCRCDALDECGQKLLQQGRAEQQKQIEALTAGLQKVSAQLEASKPAPQVVNNP